MHCDMFCSFRADVDFTHILLGYFSEVTMKEIDKTTDKPTQ